MKKYKIRKQISDNMYYNLLHYRSNIKESINMKYDDIDFNTKLTNEDYYINSIIKLIETQEPIGLILDSDSDGINCSFIYYEALKDLLNIKKIIICERKNGYGIVNEYYDILNSMDIKYVFTGDIGITAKKEVEYGKSLGIESFITDHHLVQEELRPDCCIINPKLGDDYWYDLAGCGVVYIMMKKIYDRIGREFDKERKLLHHFTVGTIGDLVELSLVNRVIVKEGLKDISETKSQGLKLILDKNFDKIISESTISFGVVPLINSMNRIGNIYNVLRFFLTEDENERIELYKEIHEKNELRKKYQFESIIRGENVIKVSINKEDQIFFINLNAQKSICGLVSSYITEKYGKPSIVVSFDKDKGIYAGSGRGCGDFNAMDLIENIKDYCIKAGGHAKAFGLSFSKENLEIIKHNIKLYGEEIKHVMDNFYIEIDKNLDIKNIDDELIGEIRKLAPYGMGNPEPLFISNNVQITSIKDNGRHTFMTVDNIMDEFTDNVWEDVRNERNAVCFNSVLTDEYGVGDLIDIVYTISVNGNILISEIIRA